MTLVAACGGGDGTGVTDPGDGAPDFGPLPTAEDFEVGVVHLGRNHYTEFIRGTLPVVVSAPHGGDREPGEIPPREGGVQLTDLRTREVARAVRNAFLDAFGAAPHLALVHLDRSRLDANRRMGEGAEGNPFAERAWREYHNAIEEARGIVEEEWGAGLYLDIHGHGHEIQRIEIGYLLSDDQLVLSNAELNDQAQALARQSSLRALWERTGTPLAELVRGDASLGGLLQRDSIPSVPSPGDPDPGGAPYFTGGFSTRLHGSRDGGTIDAAQLELYWDDLRDTQASRDAFAEALARTVDDFLRTHYGFDVGAVLGLRPGASGAQGAGADSSAETTTSRRRHGTGGKCTAGSALVTPRPCCTPSGASGADRRGSCSPPGR